ncbi:hypothetical protein BDV59DRAFT_63261 [Aspergillus ambiguus]|uniref:uncharacterized protein n=1 Tax=Aspergillus ambiguus TaxID=176160 RepID=UPI003CCE506E
MQTAVNRDGREEEQWGCWRRRGESGREKGRKRASESDGVLLLWASGTSGGARADPRLQVNHQEYFHRASSFLEGSWSFLICLASESLGIPSDRPVVDVGFSLPSSSIWFLYTPRFTKQEIR